MSVEHGMNVEQIHELYHHVGSARAIVKSIIGGLKIEDPDITRVLRHSEDALRKLDGAISEMDSVLEKETQWKN